jgi:hypothetical protein
MTAVLEHAADLEKLLVSHGVTVFGYERLDDLAVVRFRFIDRKLRLVVKMPDWNSDEYKLTPTRRGIRSATARQQAYWADVAKTWKAMRNLIAAKLEGIETGITTFEAEFTQFADAEALLSEKAGAST